MACGADGRLLLTLADAEARLHARNLDLQLGRAAVAAAAAEATIAAQRPNPSLSVNIVSISPSGGIGTGGAWDKQIDTIVRIDQVVERGGRRELRTSAATLAIAAGRSDLAETERQQRVALYAAYYDLLLAQERERIATEAIALCEKSLVDFARQGNAMVSMDYSRINIDRLKALNDLRQTRGDREKAQLNLAYLLGIESDVRRIDAVDNWPALRPVQEHALEVALDERPDVRAALARLEVAAKLRELARAQRIRDFSVGVQYERFPANSGNTVGLGISIPLFINHFYEGEIERAEAAFLAAQLNLERVRLLAAGEIGRARAELASAIERLQRYDETLLRESQSAATAAEAAYERGGLAVMDLLDARRTLYSTRIDAAVARNEHAKSQAAWKAAGGMRDLR